MRHVFALPPHHAKAHVATAPHCPRPPSKERFGTRAASSKALLRRAKYGRLRSGASASRRTVSLSYSLAASVSITDDSFGIIKDDCASSRAANAMNIDSSIIDLTFKCFIYDLHILKHSVYAEGSTQADILVTKRLPAAEGSHARRQPWANRTSQSAEGYLLL